MFGNRSALRRGALAVATGAGAVVLLAACGDDSTAGHEGMTSVSAPATASQQPSATFNDADVTFAQMMIPHHEQAVEMAKQAETRASDQELKDLATQIEAAQAPEIRTLQGLLTTWGRPATASSDMAGHEMPGMMTEDDMQKLDAAKGVEFDRMFAQMMIAHHHGAIEMAKTEQAGGDNPDAKALAKTIETTQEAEVQQLQTILDRL